MKHKSLITFARGAKVFGARAEEALARALTGDNSPSGVVSYGTEAGLFQRSGLSAAVCGPGSILQAHRADEYIELAQIDACIAFMRRLMDHVCRG